ncbi:MAG: 2-oxoacid:acceptor oxidoreductase family protein [Bryobacteraceae bacterium]
MLSVKDGFVVKHAKAKAFFPLYTRKSELQHQTHYCPGCGHGIVHKLVAKAIDSLGIQDRTILISPVGCSVFAYYYFDVGNVQGAHGRAPAVATAVKRSRPESTVISYQGDGDLSAIGSAEILHAANRGENITVIFVNNAIYGMTGGQMAPTTLLGQKTLTTPLGRDPLNEGYPLHMSELLATLQAPVYIERVALGDNKLIARADKAIHRAIENQVKGLGFSLVEVLSPCPTIWKKEPLEAQRWVREVMTQTFPTGVFCDRTKDARPRAPAAVAPPLERIPEILGIGESENAFGVVEPANPGSLCEKSALNRARQQADSHGAATVLSGQGADLELFPIDPALDLQAKIAGFGGQGVLLLGEVLAEAGLEAGLEVSWLPSYGPEMRSGTSNCQVRLSRKSIDSPLVSRPSVLIAMNEPSLRKFLPAVKPDGWVIFNGDAFPLDCTRNDVHSLARNFTHIADELGDPRATNMVMLGALLRATDLMPLSIIDAALGRLVKNQRMVELDRHALVRGGELMEEAKLEEGVGDESGCESQYDCLLQ